jgi:hypothetical protein
MQEICSLLQEHIALMADYHFYNIG